MSAKRTCVLHIGTMKTGTTSIQAWLREHNRWLNRQGWDYLGWPLRAAPEIAAKVSAANPDRNLVISDEGLWHFGQSQRSNTQEIARTLRDYDVKVIVYFRRPDLFLESWFKQGLKKGSGQPDLPRFLSLPATSSRTFMQKLDGFASIFGEENLIVAPYERSQMKNGDIVDDFLARTGIPVPPPGTLDADQTGDSKNISPGADVMLMAGLMRQIFNMPQEQIVRLMRTTPLETLTEKRTSLLTADEAARIRADFRPLFRRIQQRFGTGVEPDFFRNWADDEPHPPLCILRDAYDRYMSEFVSFGS